jgi:hypothetical protein
MKRKLKQRWSTIPAKYHLPPQPIEKEQRPRNMTLEFQIFAWDKN